ncbi:CAP domain-containing protein [Ammoniphilus sp. 3BR4]|uniref:CAP domain-containing protein n=1 Tax=Ammoniphilus sp. 3BR4 TaxID=3158265 RepID=UPI003466AD2B
MKRKMKGIGTAWAGKKLKRSQAYRRYASGRGSVRNIADDVVDLVNKERTSRGIPALISDGRLGRIAALKSIDMRDLNYFGHNSPTFGSPEQMLRCFGITFRTHGENIAWGYETPQSVVAAWMKSKPHRNNILNPKFTRTGVGWATGGQRRIIWTQLFTG